MFQVRSPVSRKLNAPWRSRKATLRALSVLSSGLRRGVGAGAVRLDSQPFARHGLAARGEDLQKNRRRALRLLQPDRAAGIERDRLVFRGGAIGRVFRREVLVFVERRDRAVIVKPVDPDQLRQFGNAAVMIGVVMRHDQVIDRRHSGLFHRLFDALRVAALEAGPARVNQDRFAGRRDDQRRRAAFDIDIEDVERAPSWCRIFER